MTLAYREIGNYHFVVLRFESGRLNAAICFRPVRSVFSVSIKQFTLRLKLRHDDREREPK